MNKNSLICLIIMLSLIMSAKAQENKYKVFPDNTDTLQYSYFMTRLQEQFDKRRADIKIASQSKEALLERRNRMRAWYSEIIGELPPKGPLNTQVTKKIEKNSYTIEAVVFESMPNHHITGLFYLPKEGEKPYPAVYIPCGHSKNGKASESYQKAARLFAINGFAVLQADPICQGERYQLLNENGLPKTNGGTMMHEFLGQALAYTGSSVVHHELYDNIRCIDFLEQHLAIDKERIAIAGNSGGGTQATYLVGYDRRIKVATPSCYIATYEKKMKTHGHGDFCQHLWGEGEQGIEEQDFLFMAAPVPIRILSAEKDFFNIDGAKQAYKELKELYSGLNSGDRVSQNICDEGHGWHKPNREAAVQWCKQWLLNDPSPVVEPEDIGFAKDEDIMVTRTGQVLRSFENEKSVFEIIDERVDIAKKKRIDYQKSHSDDELLKKIKDLIGFEEPDKNLTVENIGTIIENGYSVEKLLLERDSKRKFSLPALLFVPDKTKRGASAVLIVNQKGKNSELGKDGLISKELEKGNIVLAVDISDTGELEDKKAFNGSQGEFFTGKFPLFEGKTLLAYRTEDLIIASRFLRTQKRIDKKKIKLISIGNTSYASLHAAAFSKYYNQLEIIGEIENWEDVATSPYRSESQLTRMDNLVPDVLNYYDIPYLKSICSQKNIKVIQKEE